LIHDILQRTKKNSQMVVSLSNRILDVIKMNRIKGSDTKSNKKIPRVEVKIQKYIHVILIKNSSKKSKFFPGEYQYSNFLILLLR